MTSTTINTGYSLSRNSSKVIKPPGGETADIFGARSEPSYSSASSLAGSDVATSRVHLGNHSEQIDGIMKHQLQQQQPADGQVSPNGSLGSAASGRSQLQQQQLQLQQPLLVADDFKPTQPSQLIDGATAIQPGGQPVNLQHQKLIEMQQQEALSRSPKKTIPVLRRNPITGEILSQNPVVRVRQPPGGRSSGIF